MDEQSRIFVTEPEGLVGSALMRALRRRGLVDALLDSQAIDLSSPSAVLDFFLAARPTHVFLEAGKKGGIQANQRYPADLMVDNLRIAINVLDAACRCGTEKLLYLASACVYPRDCPQPMGEGMLLTGPLEPTNEPYSVSKIAGLKLCQAIRKQHGKNFIAAIPTNIYGPHDDFDPETAHVVGALLHRIHQARMEALPEVKIWGTGSPRREFVYCDDLADACLFLMDKYSSDGAINIGSRAELSIRDLATAVCAVVGYRGELHFDASKPDGMPLKSLDVRRLTALGWRPSVAFPDGLRRTYQWYLDHHFAALGAKP